MQKIAISVGVVLWAFVIIYGLVPGTPLNVLAKGMNSVTIGGVYVEGLEAEEMRTKLEDAVQQWRQGDIRLQSEGLELTIPARLIEFDLDASIRLHESTLEPWYAFWKTSNRTQTPLHVTVSPQLTARLQAAPIWEAEEVISEIIAQASFLNAKTIQVEPKHAALFEQERVAFKIETIPSGVAGVKEMAQLLNGRYFMVNEEKSIQQLYGQAANTNKAAMNFVASVLYATILQQKYEILERYRQESEPGYLSAGLDVAILDSIYDLRFANRTEQLHKVKATVENNELKIELYSAKKGSNVKLDIITKQVEPRTIMRYTKDLAVGKRQLFQEGKEGKRVEVYRHYHNEQGKFVKELVSQDYYPPVHAVVLTSSRGDVMQVTGSQVEAAVEEQANPIQNTGTAKPSSELSELEKAEFGKDGQLISK